MPRKNSATRAVNDTVTAARLENINQDIDDLYSEWPDRLRVRKAISLTPLHIDITAGAYYVWSTSGVYSWWTDIVVTDNTTNYVMIDNSWTITISTSARTAWLWRLAQVICSGGAVTSIILRNNMVFGGAALDMTALTEDTSPDEENDFLFSYDTSASLNKKVKPKNLDVRPFIEWIAWETLIVWESVFVALSWSWWNQTQTTTNIDRVVSYSTSLFALWQSFTPSSTWILTQISLQIKKTWAPTWTLIVQLYTDLWNTLFYTSTTTLDVSTLTTSYVTKNFNFPSVLLLSWTVYYIKISANTTISTTNYIQLWANSAWWYAWWQLFWIDNANVWSWWWQDLTFTATIWSITETAWRLYKTDADFEYKTKLTWFIRENASAWWATKVDVSLTKNLSWLLSWYDYYLSNTPWQISIWSWTILKKVWKALSATELAIEYNPA